MDYYNKYLKYKEKYLLAKQKGGGYNIEYWLIKTNLSPTMYDTIETILQKDIRTYISDVVSPPVVNYHTLITTKYNDIIRGCELFKYYPEYNKYIKELQTKAGEQINNDKDIKILKNASDKAISEKNPFDLTYIKNKYPTLDITPYTDMHINIGKKFIDSCDKYDNIKDFISKPYTHPIEALTYLLIKKTTFPSKITYEYHIGKFLTANSNWTVITSNNIN